MADKLMTGAVEVAAAIPEIWSGNFFPTLKEKMVMADSVADDYQGEIASLGDTVNIVNWPQFDAAVDLPEGSKNDADSITATSQALVINKRTVKDYIITNKAMLQSLESSNALRDLAMHSIMKKMQADIFTATVPSASSPDHQIAYDSGTTLALADILEAKELLDEADVPEAGRTMVVGSEQYNDLFNITGFTSRDFIPAGSPLTSGAIMTPVMGFQFKWTSEAADVSYFFHPQYMNIAVQKNPDVKVYDLGVEGIRAQRVNLDVLWGLKQTSDVRVVEIS